MSDAGRYTVRLDAFEGPLDLLLHLVRKNEVDIYNLPIASITDQYLQYITMFEELDLDVAGEYLVMAASLVHMKSRLLLPVDEDEEEEEEDSVANLVQQLAEYQRFREAAETLGDRALLHRDVYRREPTPPPADPDAPPQMRKVDLPDLFDALRRVLAKAAARKPHTVGKEEYSIRDAVRAMVRKLKSGRRTRFEEIFQPDAPRGLIIANFLAVLEMMKMQLLEAEQALGGGPIFLRLIDDDALRKAEAMADTYGAGEASGGLPAGLVEAGGSGDGAGGDGAGGDASRAEASSGESSGGGVPGGEPDSVEPDGGKNPSGDPESGEG